MFRHIDAGLWLLLHSGKKTNTCNPNKDPRLYKEELRISPLRPNRVLGMCVSTCAKTCLWVDMHVDKVAITKVLIKKGKKTSYYFMLCTKYKG